MLEIRQAIEEDEAAVIQLWRQLLQFYGKEAAPGVLEHSFRYAVRHPRQVRIFVAVAEEGDIAGTASLHLGHYSTWQDNWYGHIEDVIVDPRYRRRGIASALVEQIVIAAAGAGLSRLELNALADNRAARRMYEQLGFKTDSVVYERPVSGHKKQQRGEHK